MSFSTCLRRCCTWFTCCTWCCTWCTWCYLTCCGGFGCWFGRWGSCRSSFLALHGFRLGFRHFPHERRVLPASSASRSLCRPARACRSLAGSSAVASCAPRRPLKSTTSRLRGLCYHPCELDNPTACRGIPDLRSHGSSSAAGTPLNPGPSSRSLHFKPRKHPSFFLKHFSSSPPSDFPDGAKASCDLTSEAHKDPSSSPLPATLAAVSRVLTYRDLWLHSHACAGIKRL